MRPDKFKIGRRLKEFRDYLHPELFVTWCQECLGMPRRSVLSCIDGHQL
jgi:hypothetical protein